MAKETKEERTVRTMVPQLTEHMIELKNMMNNGSKESDVENWCVSLMKSVLGFSASAGYVIRTQETRGKHRFDICVYKADKPEQILLLVEVKKLGADLEKSDLRSGRAQLSEYLKSIGGSRWGILTNGFEWRLYDLKVDHGSVVTTDIRNDSQELDTTVKAISDSAWDLLDFSAFYYESNTWSQLSQEAQALSPESLARSILAIETIKKIAKILNEEHDYRVSVESLADKLSDLLENGLNDLMTSWNDTHRAEMDRYIRGQKKRAKKTRKRTSAETKVSPEAVQPIQAEQQQFTPPSDQPEKKDVA